MKKNKIIYLTTICLVCLFLIGFVPFQIHPVKAYTIESGIGEFGAGAFDNPTFYVQFEHRDSSWNLQLNISTTNNANMLFKFNSDLSYTGSGDYILLIDRTKDNAYYFYYDYTLPYYIQGIEKSDIPSSLCLTADVDSISSTFVSVILSVNTTTNLAFMYYLEDGVYKSAGFFVVPDDLDTYKLLEINGLGFYYEGSASSIDYGTNPPVSGTFYTYLQSNLDIESYETCTVDFLGDFTHGSIFATVYSSDNYLLLNKYPLNAVNNSLTLDVNSVIFVYGIANDGYYFGGVNFDFAIEDDYYSSYSGKSITIIDDCEITVTFSEWTEEFPNACYMAVSLDYSSSFMTAHFNGDTYYFGDWNNGQFEYYFSNFTVPYNTYFSVQYYEVEQYYNRDFQYWYINDTYYYYDTLITVNMSPTEFLTTENPLTLIPFYETGGMVWRDIGFYVIPSSILVNPDLTPTPIPSPSGSITPIPSTTPTSYGYVNTIMEWLFGDNGLLGEGFGTLILIIALILVIYFPQTRNVYGILLALTIVIILNIVTDLWEVWTIIVLIIAWIAFIVTQTGILNRTEE